jgi:hypothetical protein
MYDERDQSILITGRSRTGQEFTGGLGMDDVFLMKIDTAGKYKWGKLYGTTSDDQAYGLCKGSNNNYLLVGMSYDNTNFIDRGILVHIDSAGGLLDQKIITGNGGVIFLNVFPNHNSYHLFGISYSSKLSEGTGLNCPFNGIGSGALTLSKLDLWKTGIDGPAAVPADNFTLSPNPAHNSFNIRFNDKHPTGTLTGIDALGNVVFRQRIEAGEHNIVIPINDRTTGNYILSWQPSGGIKQSTVITVQ